VFLRELCKRDSRVAGILSIFESAPQPAQEWSDNDIEVMNDRLGTLVAHRHSPTLTSPLNLASETNNGGSAALDSPFSDHDLPPGWTVPGPTSGWKPSPIGVYVP